MTDTSTPATSKRRILLWAFISALAASVGYLVAELLMQHDTTWTLVGMIGITVVLTPIFYAINRRNARTAPVPASRG